MSNLCFTLSPERLVGSSYAANQRRTILLVLGTWRGMRSPVSPWSVYGLGGANLLLDRIQFLGLGAKAAYDMSQARRQTAVI